MKLYKIEAIYFSKKVAKTGYKQQQNLNEIMKITNRKNNSSDCIT